MAAPGNETLWLTVFGVVFVLIGLLFVPVAVRRVRADLASQSWPQAVATLHHAEAVRHVQERPHKDTHTQRVSHACVLHYRYRVAGQEHTARHGLAARDATHAAELVAQQNPGSQRTLFYDPQDPQRHQLERVAPWGGLVWLLPALGFAGFGALVLALAQTY